MKNLFEAATVEAVKGRIAQLKPDSERVWGKMNPAQALAHCSAANGDGDGNKETATHIHWATAGALCEEVDDCERNPMPWNVGDGQELGGE
jgi:hypothetical protein